MKKYIIVMTQSELNKAIELLKGVDIDEAYSILEALKNAQPDRSQKVKPLSPIIGKDEVANFDREERAKYYIDDDLI